MEQQIKEKQEREKNKRKEEQEYYNKNNDFFGNDFNNRNKKNYTQNIEIKNKEEKIKEILEMKNQIKTEDLCSGLPDEIKLFASYIKNLKFEEEPDYNYLKNLLKVVINSKDSEKQFYFNSYIKK